MSDIGTSEGASADAEMPVEEFEEVKFPPFPEPSDKDFDEDLFDDEKVFYKSRFPDVNAVVNLRLHCTACDRHLGCSAKNESRMRPHPMLRTLICHTCHSFYNSGEFDKGEDGSELYCRWCGQGGQVYCCSDCVHVFCAKCIKRNLGVGKIKEIENTDDWKCFKCNPKSLWELRATCWALLRFCDIRNKILYHTEDPELKDKYQRAIATDSSECCRKGKRKEKTDSAKKKEAEIKRNIPRLPPTIQVKKFASINVDVSPKVEKKAQKRPASPKIKISGFIQKPIAIAPGAMPTPPLKKIRMPAGPLLNPVRLTMDRKISNTYSRLPNKPRQTFPVSMSGNSFNGLQNPFSVNMSNFIGDNINLSLETLTQGLDMAAMAAFNNNAASNNVDNDVVCTPDFPLEPLCEVTEDNDDDVECITPGPVAAPKVTKPPPLVTRALPDLSNDNIVQMTENDVTVNTLTGGLKFRVDPQTLSSKKMYRLPDGRIFAINPNPNMPGGYSATIVSVSDATGKASAKGGETFAAKLSAVTPSPTSSGSNSKTRNSLPRKQKGKMVPKTRGQKARMNEKREFDLKVPVEWYRYNLIDAVDALDYSLSRLNKLKKEATTAHLRTRNVDEVKYLHRTLEQLLTTSSKRFLEIRDSLNKELKEYISKKTGSNTGDITEDDDDVEFLPNSGEDPIFIDENSMDSVNVNESQEVDLTGIGTSEHNDSGEKGNVSDPLLCNEELTTVEKDVNNASDNLNESAKEPGSPTQLNDKTIDKEDEEKVDEEDAHTNNQKDNKPNGDMEGDAQNDKLEVKQKNGNRKNDKKDSELTEKPDVELNVKKDGEIKKERDETTSDTENNCKSNDNKSDEETDEINGDVKDGMDIDRNDISESKVKVDEGSKQTEDTEMSEETIESLLKDNEDTLGGMDVSNASSLDVLDQLGDKQ